MNPFHNQNGPAACSPKTPARFPSAARGLPGPLRLWRALALAALLSPIGAFAQTTTPLVSLTNTAWRYNDSGIDLGTAWRAVSYPAENLWPTGRGLFGVESTVPYPYPEPIATPLVLNAGRTTYYFRTRFNFGFNPSGLALRLTAYVDDGAVFYLNGLELHRVRLPANVPIAFTNKAALAFPEGIPVVLNFPATNVVRGDNVLAVEIHQHSDTSSDVVFGLALAILTADAPEITDPSEPADRAVPQGGSTTLRVVAAGLPPPAYQWFKDGAALPGEIGPTLTLENMSASQGGNYFCQVSNIAGIVNSRTAVVTYLPDTNGPTILYALGRPTNPYEVVVVFSEPPSTVEATDNFNWKIQAAGGGPELTIQLGFMEDPTRLVLPTAEPREPGLSYTLELLLDVPELVNHGNVLPAGTVVPIALFESTLIQNNGVQTWRYDQSGSDLSTDWVSPGYDDSGWLTGTDPFDVFRRPGTPPPGVSPTCRESLPLTIYPVNTCLTLSNAANTAQIPTIYFRTHFTFEGDAAHSLLRLEAVVDDGAVFYLNGTEIARLGMPSAPITYNTPASRDSDSFVPALLEVDAPTLVAGDNVLAVELHQVTLASPDMTFSLKVSGVLPDPPRPRLTARLVGGNLQLTWSPEGGTLESTDDPAGGWTPVTEAHSPGQYVTPPGDTKRFYRVALP